MSVKRKRSELEAEAKIAKPKKPRPAFVQPEEVPFPRGNPSNGLLSSTGDQPSPAANDLFGNGTASTGNTQSKILATKPPRAIPQKPRYAGHREVHNLDLDHSTVLHLNPHHLESGQPVLGLIVEIRPQELVLSLPNNLIGYVSAASISPAISAALRLAHDSGDVEMANAEITRQQGVDLRKLFKVSQYLRAAEIPQDEGPIPGAWVPKPPRTALTIEPSAVNSQICRNEIVVGAAIQASIASVEDHGYVMDCGLSLEGLRGFLPKSADPEVRNRYSWEQGAVMLCIISSLAKKSPFIGLSVEQKDIKNPTTKQTVASLGSVKNLAPGTPIVFDVTRVLERGIIGTVAGGSYQGSINSLHTGQYMTADPSIAHVQPGQKIVTRILAMIMSSDPKKEQSRLLLTMIDTQLSLSPPLGRPTETTLDPELRKGAFVTDAKVIHVHPYGFGVFMDIKQPGSIAFLHISRTSDRHISEEEMESRFAVGTLHRVRILNYHAIDAVYDVTAEPSVLSQKYLRTEDVVVGERVDAKIVGMSLDHLGRRAIELSLGERVSALVPENHIADVALREPDKKFRKDTLVKARVLSRHEITDKLHCTLRRSFVTSTLSPMVGIEDVDQAKFYLGLVTNVQRRGAVVRFYQNVQGFLPADQIREDSDGTDATTLIEVGKTIEVRFTTDRTSPRMPQLSALPIGVDSGRKSKSASDLAGGDLANPIDPSVKSRNDLWLNNTIRVVVKSVTVRQLNVGIAQGVEGRISSSLAFDNIKCIKNRKKPLEVFRKGQILVAKIVGQYELHQPGHRFLPFSHNQIRGIGYEMTIRPVDMSVQAKVLKAADVPELAEERVAMLGFVTGHKPDGVYVALSPSLTTVINEEFLPRKRSKTNDLEECFPSGYALEVSIRDHYITKAMHRIFATGAGIDINAGLTYETVQPSQILTGIIIRHKDDGMIIRLNDNVSGFVSLSELSDDYDDVGGMRAHWRLFKAIQVKVIACRPASAATPKQTDPELITHHRPGNYSRLDLSIRRTSQTPLDSPPKDLRIDKARDLEPGQKLRGFITEVKFPIGIFVELSSQITGLIPMSEVSDKFLTNLDDFKPQQLIEVKVARVRHDVANGKDGSEREDRVVLTHKQSHLDNSGYQPRLEFDQLKVGMAVTAKVRGINNYGIFVRLDDSEGRLDGLCRPNELSKNRDLPEDLGELYAIGDHVKAVVTHINLVKKQFNVSLDPEKIEAQHKIIVPVLPTVMNGAATSPSISNRRIEDDNEDAATDPGTGLKGGDFDFTGDIFERTISEPPDIHDLARMKKASPRKAKEQDDVDLDASGPSSRADYERWLIADPENTQLWKGYIRLSLAERDVLNSRLIAERAIRTISSDEEGKKMAIWVELMELELASGTDETLDRAFKEACATMDPVTVHRKLAQIYLKHKDHANAITTFKNAAKIKDARKDLAFWEDYAKAAFEAGEVRLARVMHGQARKSIAPDLYVSWGMYFAKLEFSTEAGDAERGRKIFEYIIAQLPNRLDVWGVYVDREMQLVTKAQKAHPDQPADLERVRGLMHRITSIDSSFNSTQPAQLAARNRRSMILEKRGPRLSMRNAKSWFNRWERIEELYGDPKAIVAVHKQQGRWMRMFEEKQGTRAPGPATAAKVDQ